MPQKKDEKNSGVLGTGSTRELEEERAEGIEGELRGVEGGGRNASEGVGERFGGKGVQFGQFPALDKFSEERGCGDRGSAAAAEKTGCMDAIVVEDGCELQDVSADRIADFDAGGGSGEFASIARALEVVEERVAEHVGEYPSDQ